MSAEPIVEPVMTQQDPIGLLIAIEEASRAPIRPEYIAGFDEVKVGLGEPLPLPAPYPALDTAPFLES